MTSRNANEIFTSGFTVKLLVIVEAWAVFYHRYLQYFALMLEINIFIFSIDQLGLFMGNIPIPGK